MAHANCLYLLKKGGEQGREGVSPQRLNQLAIKLALHLETFYKKDEKILVAIELGIEFIVTLLACIYAHKTFIPIPIPKTNADRKRIESIQKDCGVSLAFITNRTQYFFDTLNIGSIFKDILTIDLDLIDQYYANSSTLEETFHTLQSDFQDDRNFLAVIQYTSGSTNSPKGVKITNENILANYERVYLQNGVSINLKVF